MKISTTTLPLAARRLGAVLVATALVLSGCASVPDLSGYRGATVSLQESVRSAGAAVGTEISLASDAAQSRAMRKNATEFDKAWKVRTDAIDALVRYAGSLEAIAAAGNSGEESVKELGSAVDGLLGAVGVTPQTAAAAQAVSLVKDVAEIGYGEYAKRKAINSLRDSIAATGPIMTHVVQVIDEDVLVAKQILAAATKTQLDELEVRYETVANGDKSTYSKLRDSLEFWVLTTDDELGADAPRLDRVKKQNTLVGFIKARLDALSSERRDYLARRSSVLERQRSSLGLIEATSDGLRAWAKSHADLADALARGAPVDLSALAGATARIIELINERRKS